MSEKSNQFGRYALRFLKPASGEDGFNRNTWPFGESLAASFFLREFCVCQC